MEREAPAEGPLLDFREFVPDTRPLGAAPLDNPAPFQIEIFECSESSPST